MDARKTACAWLTITSLLFLTACDSNPDPTTIESTTAASTSTQRSTTSEVAKTTHSESPTAASPTEYKPATAEHPAVNVPIPSIPPEGTTNTEDGAAAFALYYFELINYTGETTDSEPILEATSENCSVCFDDIIDPADYSKSIGEWQVGGTYRAEIVNTRKTSNSIALVSLQFESDPFKTYVGSNELAGEYTEVNLTDAVLQLSFSDHWIVDKIIVAGDEQ